VQETGTLLPGARSRQEPPFRGLGLALISAGGAALGRTTRRQRARARRSSAPRGRGPDVLHGAASLALTLGMRQFAK
jgi:hypothetical protein